MNPDNPSVPLRKTAARRRGILARLASLLKLGAKPDDWSVQDLAREKMRRGKHNGRTPGAAGNRNAMKAHRRKYELPWWKRDGYVSEGHGTLMHFGPQWCERMATDPQHPRQAAATVGLAIFNHARKQQAAKVKATA